LDLSNKFFFGGGLIWDNWGSLFLEGCFSLDIYIIVYVWESGSVRYSVFYALDIYIIVYVWGSPARRGKYGSINPPIFV